jgi:oligopeptide transport system substrate-binding protein
MNKYIKILTTTLFIVISLFAINKLTLAAGLAKDTLYLPLTSEPGTIDPNHASGTWEREIIDNIFTGLMELDAKGKTKKALAESWAISKDGKVYTFKLKQTLWNDGTPLTANDFVFSYERMLNPLSSAKYAEILYPIAGAEEYNTGKINDFSKVGVKAIDNYTLQITLKEAESFFTERLLHYTYYPIPEHIVKKHGKAWTKVGNIVSNGAYNIIEWTPNKIIKLIRNEKFYENALTKINNIHFLSMGSDVDIQYKAFQANQIDISSFDAKIVDKVKANFKDQVYIFPIQAQSYLSINALKPSNKALLNPDVRKAMMYAYDSSFIIPKVKGLSIPATSIIPPSMGSYNPVKGFWVGMETKQRIEEAKKLMEKNGYNQKNRVKIKYYHMNNKTASEVVTLVKNLFEQIYIDLELVPLDTNIFYDEITAHNHDVAAMGWSADYNDASTFFYIMMSGVGNNYSGYSNKELDKLVKEGMKELDEKKRNALYAKAEQIAQKDLFYLPYVFFTDRLIISKRVMNWAPNAQGHFLVRWLDLSR